MIEGDVVSRKSSIL